MYNMQSNCILIKLSFLHKHTLRDIYTTRLLRYWWCVAQSHASHTICRSIHVMNFCEADPLLNVCVNFIVHWVQILVLEPQAWWNELDYIPFQKYEMGDTGTEAVRTHWADIVLQEDKELNRSCTWQAVAVESEVCYGNRCKIIWITLNKKINEFRCKFL